MSAKPKIQNCSKSKNGETFQRKYSNNSISSTDNMAERGKENWQQNGTENTEVDVETPVRSQKEYIWPTSLAKTKRNYMNSVEIIKIGKLHD
jgi:hypothetical protein